MNVWILEDEPDHAAALLEKMKAYPGSRAFAVRVFSSPQALREARQAGQEPDLLLTDIRLGEEESDGISLVASLFEGSGVPVIYITGFVEYCTKVYETDHVYFLTKPLRTDELFAAAGFWPARSPCARAARFCASPASRSCGWKAGAEESRCIPPAASGKPTPPFPACSGRWAKNSCPAIRAFS